MRVNLSYDCGNRQKLAERQESIDARVEQKGTPSIADNQIQGIVPNYEP